MFGDEMWVHSTFPDLDAALVRLQTLVTEVDRRI